MNAIRRVVTGSDDGFSSILDDQNVPFRDFAPGVEVCELWHEVDLSGDPRQLALDAPATPMFPQPGQLAVRIVKFWPFDKQAKDKENEILQNAGDVATDGGLHATPTQEYYVVLSGTVHLLLQEGEIAVHPGDCVILLGGHHSWENRGDQPAELFSVMFGAHDTGEAASIEPAPTSGASLPKARRIVAGRKANGRSGILIEGGLQAQGVCQWMTAGFPPRNRFDCDTATAAASAGAASLWRGSVPPDKTSEMARRADGLITFTVLVDGQMVAAGESAGQVLHARDVLVRRGGQGPWRNDCDAAGTFYTVAVVRSGI